MVSELLKMSKKGFQKYKDTIEVAKISNFSKHSGEIVVKHNLKTKIL